MTDLHSLLTRVEEATRPDRELDHDLLMITPAGAFLREHGYERDGDGYITSRPPISGAAKCSGPQPYTASLDAALALVEAMLPGANYRVSRTGGDWRPGFIHSAYVMAPYSGAGDHESGYPRADGDGATSVLALLSALLRAIAKQEVEDG